MRIVHAQPPLWPEIVKAFPGSVDPGTIFAWGDKIYIPKPAGKLPDALHRHEEVHGRQQGSDIEGWWRRYMADPKFRLAQEIPAHRAEYDWWAAQPGADKPMTGWRARKEYNLFQIAKRLASPLYGRLMPSVGAARKAILAAEGFS